MENRLLKALTMLEDVVTNDEALELESAVVLGRKTDEYDSGPIRATTYVLVKGNRRGFRRTFVVNIEDGHLYALPPTFVPDTVARILEAIRIQDTIGSWVILDGHGIDELGLLPGFLNTADPDDAVTQLDKNYQHGGGWQDFEGFTLNGGDDDRTITYAGDPPYAQIAYFKLRDETVVVFPYAWVAVIQQDGAYRVARMD